MKTALLLLTLTVGITLTLAAAHVKAPQTSFCNPNWPEDPTCDGPPPDNDCYLHPEYCQ